MVPAFNPMSCPRLAVPAEVMQHVAQVESSANPFAIGVVGGRLARQPRSLGEAVATARMLEAKGYNYSLGLTQVNRSNLTRYGLDTFEQAFDGCTNLAAGARILAECYGRSGHDWGKAFSCYYSGNFATGYREGYVQRVYDSIGASLADASGPITVYPESRERPAATGEPTARAAPPGSPAHRISIRSVAWAPDATALVFPTARTAGPADTQPVPEAKEEAGIPSDPAFVPRVSGPSDPPVRTIAANRSPAASAASNAATQAISKETADAAFVF